MGYTDAKGLENNTAKIISFIGLTVVVISTFFQNRNGKKEAWFFDKLCWAE